MTLNALRALSEGDTIKFPKAALEQIVLCPKGADEGPVGYLGKSNGLYTVSFPSENKAAASDAMEIELLTQSIEDAASAEEIDQYLSGLEGLVDNSDGSKGGSTRTRRNQLDIHDCANAGCNEHSGTHCNKENP